MIFLGNEQRMVGIMQAKRENKRKELQRNSQKAINTPVLSTKKKKKYFVTYVCLPAYTYVYHVHVPYWQRPEEWGVSSRTELEITVGCHEGTGKWTHVLYKSKKYTEPSF